MRDPHVQPAATMRPDRASSPGCDSGDDTGRFRGPVPSDGRGAVRTGSARVDGGIPPSGITQCAAEAVSGGGQCASGTGRADGRAVRPPGSCQRSPGPDFTLNPPHGGYVWWYIDALSDDGEHGITLIAFIGSVFSPYYAFGRRRGQADPLQHCALNVALYGARKRWAMTERRTDAVQRGADFLAIGPSALQWDGSTLTVTINEVTVPVPHRLRGTLRLHPCALETRSLALDLASRHSWQPIAPCARVELKMDRP